MKELSFFWTVSGCPVGIVFLGDRRCAPTPPLPLVCRAARLPQPPPFDISALAGDFSRLPTKEDFGFLDCRSHRFHSIMCTNHCEAW